MHRRWQLSCVLFLSALGACGFGTTPPESDVKVPERHLVSLVHGCLDVPMGLHTFKVTDFRDAFAGTVATTSHGPAVLRWSTGMWDFQSLLREFNPSGPSAGSSAELGEGIWRARRGNTDFLVLRKGRGMIFAELGSDAEAVGLRIILLSYRQGEENCSEAEKVMPYEK